MLSIPDDPAIQDQMAQAAIRMRARARRAGYEVEIEDGQTILVPEKQAFPLRTPDITLHNFIRQGWHVLEPVRPFTDNWHIGAISEHLTACNTGQIQRLIINVPPGSSKSLTACVFWFTWTWTFDPSSRWLFCSHNAEFATRDSLKSRNLIQSDWYQQRYKDVFQFRGDQNLKTYFENTRTGFRIAKGMSGTGIRAKYIVADDPHEIEKAESDNDRNRVVTVWNETISQRGEDDKSPLIIIMQRLNPRDLTGDQLAKDLGYDHLCLPMEFEYDHPFKSKTTLGFVDPRSREGELIDPIRFPPESLPLRKRQLGNVHAVAGQLQQRPTARGGEMFKMEWFKKVNYVPLAADRVRYWDKAGTTDAGAWTVGALVARKLKMMIGQFAIYDYFIEDVVYGQWSLNKREKTIKETADKDAKKYGEGEVLIVMEQEPGSSGKDVTRLSIHNLAPHRAIRDLPGTDGNKEIRAEPLANMAEQGDVSILIAPWTEWVLEQVIQFPHGGKDFVDAIGGAYRRLAQRKKKDKPKTSSSSSVFE